MTFSTPLYKAMAISASEMQNRAFGEISTVPSAPIGVCSPPRPRTPRPYGFKMATAFSSEPPLVKLGILMWTEARIPVPMLVGQEVITPKSGDLAQPPGINRSKTSLMQVDFFMAMIRKWSSSPTQIMKPLSAEIKHPRPEGQSPAIPAVTR